MTNLLTVVIDEVIESSDMLILSIPQLNQRIVVNQEDYDKYVTEVSDAANLKGAVSKDRVVLFEDTDLHMNNKREYSEPEKDEKGYLICKICGEAFYSLGHHVAQVHGVSAKSYKEKYGYKSRGSLTAEKRHP